MTKEDLIEKFYESFPRTARLPAKRVQVVRFSCSVDPPAKHHRLRPVSRKLGQGLAVAATLTHRQRNAVTRELQNARGIRFFNQIHQAFSAKDGLGYYLLPSNHGKRVAENVSKSIPKLAQKIHDSY